MRSAKIRTAFCTASMPAMRSMGRVNEERHVHIFAIRESINLIYKYIAVEVSYAHENNYMGMSRDVTRF